MSCIVAGILMRSLRLLGFVTFAAITPVAIAADSATNDTSLWNSKVLVAIIAMFGAAITALVSAFISYVIAKNTAINAVKEENRKRQNELALKISDLVSVSDENARRAAMRRYAVAIIKVVKPQERKEHGIVHFVPMNSRVTVGRSGDNDIVLSADERSLSRWHCGFIADQHSVWVDDYRSLNGTLVNGEPISGSCLLKDGDTIGVGPFELAFKTVRENTILSQ